MNTYGIEWDRVQPGEELPPLPPIRVTRLMLALYCGASGDHNPVHVDADFARDAGIKDVFAHGMLSAAWMARLVTRWLPQAALDSFDVRFLTITHVGELISCTGRVDSKFEQDGRRLVKLQLETRNEHGMQKLSGTAVAEIQ
ncbi:MAG TPA: MaoC/PaaZ C-terminal domain-containing protein [Burkholderiaceae bacterium]|nr:MaoC/PaaZ C-terminal domain-containing protein [Burkholderiaceae bacterium]